MVANCAVSGPDTGSPCMFPFIWEGVTYTSCVASDDENSTSTWCDTRVDATSASGWGWCNDDCRHAYNRPKHECKEELGLEWIYWEDWENTCQPWIEPPVLTDHGKWGPTRVCSSAYVVGMKVKMQEEKGWKGDDTGINAIRLICDDGEELVSAEGHQGEWSEPMKGKGIMIGVQFRSDGDSLSDDAATAGVRFMDWNRDEYIYEGYFGKWQDWKECPHTSAIIGFQTQVEGYKTFRDNTALNRVRFICG